MRIKRGWAVPATRGRRPAWIVFLFCTLSSTGNATNDATAAIPLYSAQRDAALDLQGQIAWEVARCCDGVPCLDGTHGGHPGDDRSA